MIVKKNVPLTSWDNDLGWGVCQEKRPFDTFDRHYEYNGGDFPVASRLSVAPIGSDDDFGFRAYLYIK